MIEATKLKTGQRVTIANTLMQFYYWQGDTPVFTYNADGFQINYINHEFNRDSIFQIK